MDKIIAIIANNVYLPNVEIEARLGVVNLNKFDPDINKDMGRGY